jgi:uncharacterized surface protein with fasciclin (FAS1) repeats
MTNVRRLLLLSLCCWAQAQNTLVSKIYERTTSDSDPNGLSLFSVALQSSGMLDGFLSNATQTFTVFAPTNAAIKASPQFLLYLKGLNAKPVPRWHQHVRAALQQHILLGQVLNSSSIFDLKVTKLNSMLDPIVVSQFGKTLQGAAITEADISASNGVLHVVNAVIQPKFYGEPFSQVELQQELGPDYLGRTALVDVVDFVGGREVLNKIDQQGTTFVGCRVRAFNRLSEYLPQTINGSPDGVIIGEFLNKTNKAETLKDFIEYSMIPKNYYNDDILDGFMDLIVPDPNCGHMWVTKNQGKLCFNNGCVVASPNQREYIASNGYV